MCLLTLILTLTSENNLEKCLNSIISQSFNDFELIIINKISNRNVEEVLNKYKKHNQINFLDNNHDLLLNELKNNAIRKSSGKYVNFLTQDNFLYEEDTLEIVFNILSEENIEMLSLNTVFSYNEYFKESSNPFVEVNDIKNYSENGKLLADEYGSPLFLSRNFLCKDFLIRNNISFGDCREKESDMLFLSEVLTNIESFITSPIIYCEEMMNSRMNTPEMIIEYLKCYNSMLKIFDDRKIYSKILESISRSIIKLRDMELTSFSFKAYKMLEIEFQNTVSLFDENNYELSYLVKRKLRYVKNRIYNRITKFNVAISIIIPTYNVEDYIDECLVSLFNQTFKNFEIIIVDDSSTDRTVDILKEYQKIDYRIRIIDKPHKSGSGGARNYGMKYAKGKYVLFLDADDYLDLNTLERLYYHSEKHEVDLVMFKLINYDEKEKVFFKSDYFTITSLKEFNNSIFNIDDVEDRLFLISVTPVNKLHSRIFLESLDVKFPENYIHQDNPFFYEIFCNAEKVYLDDEYFYNRRLTDSSISTKLDDTQIGTIEIVEYMLNVFLKYDLYEKYKHRLLNLLVYKVRNRRKQVGEEFKEEYFVKARRKFFKFMEEYALYNDLNECLNKENRIYFDSVISSGTYDEYLEQEKNMYF